MPHPMDMFCETIRCVCLRYSTENEVARSLRRVTGISEREILSALKWPGKVRRETLHAASTS